MEKPKLGICIADEEYKQRFVKCLMKYYKEQYEIHVINHICEQKLGMCEKFDVMIVEDDSESIKNVFGEMTFLILKELKGKEYVDTNNNCHYVEKYQEVYKIMKEVQIVIGGGIQDANVWQGHKNTQRIGIFSLCKEVMQVPFAALLAEILGEQHSILLVDLQPFSGLATEIEMEDVLGMEDLLSIATTENYTKNRVNASIGHEQKWDYVYPAKNTSCFAEVEIKIYQKMFEILESQQSYEYIIINFGSMFSGITEFMENCQEMYVLTENKEERNYREVSFLEEINRRGKSNLMEKLMWIELSNIQMRYSSWRQLSKQWLWGSVGDILRERYWVEYADRTDM